MQQYDDISRLVLPLLGPHFRPQIVVVFFSVIDGLLEGAYDEDGQEAQWSVVVVF